jgi:hypothetical protein
MFGLVNLRLDAARYGHGRTISRRERFAFPVELQLGRIQYIT